MRTMTIEQVLNGNLAEVLRGASMSWKIYSDESRHTQGAKIPDVLIVPEDLDDFRVRFCDKPHIKTDSEDDAQTHVDD